METRNELIPSIATHPGVVVREELKERGISQRDFAAQTGMQPTHLNEIIKGKRSVNVDIAIAFEKALGISAQTWMNLQSGYEYDVKAINARDKANAEASLKEAAYKVYFCLTYIYKYFKTNIYSAVDRLKTLEGLMTYEDLSQSAIEEFCYAGRFKRSAKVQVDEKNVRTWQLVARKICADAKVEVPFVKGNADVAAREIATLAKDGTLTEAKINDSLNRAGIFYYVLEKLDKAPIDAYSVMIDGKPSIVVTHRYDDIDKLAFDVLHELCHIERHITEGRPFVSIDGDEYAKDPIEVEANTYARDRLISPEVWKEIMNSKAKDLSPFRVVEAIAREAKKRGISPTLAVSRYKYESSTYNVAKYRSPRIK